ncbi:thioredoxin [Ferroacidibacillus organovorans]|nr:thioredoxin [Ferroacidibacillus organovorans]
MMKTLQTAEYDTLVGSSTKPVILDFSADW